MATGAIEMRSDDGDAVVSLSYGPVDRDCGTLTIKVRAAGLHYDAGVELNSDKGVLTVDGDGLPLFLAALATDWRGWEGRRSWETIEGGLSIEATHHGNRVRLLFIVRRESELDGWEFRLPLLVAPGESLARIAAAARTHFETAV